MDHHGFSFKRNCLQEQRISLIACGKKLNPPYKGGMRLAISNCNVTMLEVTLQYRFTSLYAQQMYRFTPINWCSHCDWLVSTTCKKPLFCNRPLHSWWHGEILLANWSCSVYCICVSFHNQTQNVLRPVDRGRQSEVYVWEKTYIR
jgi:hypothetical protein